MADQNTNENNLLSDPTVEAVSKFQGFSTVDGERVDPAKESKPAKESTPKNEKTKQPANDVKSDADDSADDDNSDDDGSKHKSAQKRINKAVGKQRSAERRAEAAEAAYAAQRDRLAALEARIEAMANGGKPTKQRDENQPPQPADYEYGEIDTQYIRDLAKYEVRQELKADKEQTSRQTQQTQQTEQQTAFKQKLDGFLDSGLEIYDDFDEVVLDNSNPFSSQLVELMFESEHGQEIAYQAASDAETKKKLSAMSPSRQAAWFGRMEADLSSKKSDADEEEGEEEPKSSPQISKAPKPLRKSRGNGAPSEASGATSDFAQFEKVAMQAQG